MIYNGVEINTKIKDKRFIGDRFILTLGALDKRKNTELLIKSYLNSHLRKNGIKLKIVGLQDIGLFCRKFKLDEAVLRKSGIEMFEYIDDNDLHILYQKCLAFLYISLGEGFGLPIIEAQLLGAKVITSDCTSCAEVSGPSATLVNPKSVSQITSVLNGIPFSETTNHPLDVEWLKRFAWENIIYQYLNVYEKKN